MTARAPPSDQPLPGTLGRRAVIIGVAAAWVGARTARGQEAEADLVAAEGLMRDAGNRLAAIAAETVTPEERRRRLAALLDAVVDIPGVAQFCLGRFWRVATAEQQRAYVAAFRAVLARNVGSRMGDYRAGGIAEVMRVTTGHPVRRGELIEVPTTVERPHNAPAHVTWVVRVDAGGARIVDVVAEGVSLRLTERGDHAAFMARHGNDIEALVAALRAQVATE